MSTSEAIETQQTQWMIGVGESAPSLGFLAMWRGGVDLELAGWIGAAMAVAVLAAFRRFGVRNDPILLGLNLHLIIAAPAIAGAFYTGAELTARWMIEWAPSGVLISITCVGGVTTFASERGFIDDTEMPRMRCYHYSLMLLVAACAAIPWSVLHHGNALMATVLPIMVLFGFRRFLRARAMDNNGAGPAAVLVPVDVHG